MASFPASTSLVKVEVHPEETILKFNEQLLHPARWRSQGVARVKPAGVCLRRSVSLGVERFAGAGDSVDGEVGGSEVVWLYPDPSHDKFADTMPAEALAGGRAFDAEGERRLPGGKRQR